MTLSTDIVIREPVNPEALFLHLLGLLGRFPGAVRDPQWSHHIMAGSIVARSGQGLPAWLIVSYADDGPLYLYDDDEVTGRRQADPTWTAPAWNSHCVRVNVDTNYNYDRFGARCGDVHAFVADAVRTWCAERDVNDVWWCNEFVEDGRPVTDLTDLGDPRLLAEVVGGVA